MSFALAAMPRSMKHMIARLLGRDGLSIVGNDEIVSKDGWQLRFTGCSPSTWQIHYVEGDKAIAVHADAEAGGPSGCVWSVPLSDIRGWGQEERSEAFTDEDRKRITANVRRGMRALKYVCRIN